MNEEDGSSDKSLAPPSQEQVRENIAKDRCVSRATQVKWECVEEQELGTKSRARNVTKMCQNMQEKRGGTCS